MTLLSPESEGFPLAAGSLSFYLCSMDRLAIPSDDAPEPARRAGLARQYVYWRGASGRRYLFSAVGPDSLADFRDAVVIFAEPDGDRLVGRSVFAVGDAPAACRPAAGETVFIHLLAAAAPLRERIVADLTAPGLGLAA